MWRPIPSWVAATTTDHRSGDGTVIVIDEYLAVRVVGGAWPEGLPDDEDLGLPASRH